MLQSTLSSVTAMSDIYPSSFSDLTLVYGMIEL
jgi:hypothetical protein